MVAGMNITLPFPPNVLQSGYLRVNMGDKIWHGFFGIPIEGNALAAHPFGPEDRAIMPTQVFDQEMANRIRKVGPGFEYDFSS